METPQRQEQGNKRNNDSNTNKQTKNKSKTLIETIRWFELLLVIADPE